MRGGIQFGQGMNHRIGASRWVLRQIVHVFITVIHTDGISACGFGGENVIVRIADHRQLLGLYVQHLTHMLQRQRRGFFLGQGIATDDQAEFV